MDTRKNQLSVTEKCNLAQNSEMHPDRISDTSKETWYHIVDCLVKSFDHNADSVLDISKDIQAIQSLAPDDMYRNMIEAIYADAHLSMVEKNDQALRILQQRQEDQKHAAGIVTELQTKQADNFNTVSTGHSHWAALVFGGIVVTVLSFTPGGRNFVKQGLRILTKGSIGS